MRTILLFVIVALPLCVRGQAALEKVIETERAFAATAAEKGTKHAFLQFTAPDGVLFLPAKIKTTDYWNTRGESPGLLSWAPNYADVSANGMFGYTTGNWESRAKRDGDSPTGFGQFITVWQRMPDGNYRYVIDVGISHPKPPLFSTEVSPAAYPANLNEKKLSAADSATGYFRKAEASGLGAAYKSYAAEHIRGFREGELPLIGKKPFLNFVGKSKGQYIFQKRGVFMESGDLAYLTNTYTVYKGDEIAERGNFVQVWKLIGDRWQIVLDVFKPVPEPKS